MTPPKKLVTAVNALGEPGIAFSRSPRRLYPNRRLAAHFIGYTAVDGYGQAGIQRQIGTSGIPMALRIETSIDARIQHVLEAEMERSIAAMPVPRSEGAAGVVLDTNSGELLAIASYPNFDPNERQAFAPNALYNRATMGVYEFGPPLQAVTAAGRWQYGDAWYGRRRQLFEQLGMTTRVQVDLAEVTQPLLPGDWQGPASYEIEQGAGIAVSPLHLANAYAALVNGGRYRPVSVLRLATGAVPPGRQVVSPQTSAGVRELLRFDVMQGASRAADAPGYRVGGLHGVIGYNPGQRISFDQRRFSPIVRLTFAGAFPIDRPRYVVVVMFDGVRRGTYEPSTAPATARRIIQRIGPILGVEPG